MKHQRAQLKAFELRLSRAGFVEAGEEVEQLFDASRGDLIACGRLVDRREGGEPLEWLIGYVVFMGNRIGVDRGVFVPRPQSELIARSAIAALPRAGTAVDLCTGTGAIAVALRHACPGARVVATDVDEGACRCAARNGVEVYQGHLADPLPAAFHRACDVVVAVVPYVPTDEIVFLPRDVRTYEPAVALDGGVGGVELLSETIAASSRLLRIGGSLVVELGGDQDDLLNARIAQGGFRILERLVDAEGDLRGLRMELTAYATRA